MYGVANIPLIAILTLSAFTMNMMYFWQCCKGDDLKPRLFWLRTIVVDIGIRIAIVNATVWVILFSAYATELCELENEGGSLALKA